MFNLNINIKLPKVVQSMLQDKNVLYIVAFLAAINFFGYIILRDSYALLIFLSIGFITTYFSKNMTVVLIVTLILTNFITVISRNLVSGKEGFDAAINPDAIADESATQVDGVAEAAKPAKPAKPAAAAAKPAATAAAAKPAATAAAAKPAGVMGAGTSGKASKNKVTTTASSTSTQKSLTEPMTELSPANINDDDDLPVNNRVDYAKTLETAYDNLENLVGQDGVRGLTSQTNTLMDQQQKLMENMKSMEPLLKTAQSFLDKFESSSMGKIFDKIPGMSAMFGGGGGSTPKAVAQ